MSIDGRRRRPLLGRTAARGGLWDGRRPTGQPFGKKYFLMLSPSVLNSTSVPRNWRICLLVRLIMPWRLPRWANSTLPVAVILKRFLAPDLVLSLGIWLSFAGNSHGNKPRLPGFCSI